MSRVAIHADSVGKRYRIGERASYLTLRDRLAGAAKFPVRWFRSETPGAPPEPRHIWALRDISFDLNEGEILGVIGRNGAGKSTLLKVLSRVTQPTEGAVEVRGRMGSLLEVGTGFHPELTGRENIFLNGAILGMRRREIARKFDEIVAFAEVDKFVDTPVKHYSSGMYTRLAFSVAAHLEPEILIVDEVLSVGDVAFQKKCLGKMGKVAQEGRTVVLVSHQMNQVRRLCEKVMWMDGGVIRQAGPTGQVVGAYEAAATSMVTSGEADHGERAHFLGWEILEPRGELPHMLTSLGPVTIRFIVEVREPLRHGQHGAALFNLDRQLMWAWAKDDVRLEPGIHSFLFTFPMLPLRPGGYVWQVSLWEDQDLLELWDCLPEMNIATEIFQHPRDEWNGVLNVPCHFVIQDEKEVKVGARANF